MVATTKYDGTFADQKTLEPDRPSTASQRTLAEPRDDPEGDVEQGVAEANARNIDEKASATITSDHNPNVIDWDSSDDPDRAINWSRNAKVANIGIISFITFLTPLASSMVAPGVPLIMKDFKSTDATIASFIVSIYILGYALGPLFLAPMSEVYGRLPVYHVSNASFVVWTIGCALAPNMSALLFFRLMAGIAGSCPLTIGGGSIADLIVPSKRGGAMAIFALGPLLGPVIGPVAGGFLAEDKGWRWVFWLITIAVGLVLVFPIFQY